MSQSENSQNKSSSSRGSILWIEEDGGENFGEVKEVGMRNENDFSIDCKFEMRNYTLMWFLWGSSHD